MIIKKLSVAKTGPEVKRTLLYVLKKARFQTPLKKSPKEVSRLLHS